MIGRKLRVGVLCCAVVVVWSLGQSGQAFTLSTVAKTGDVVDGKTLTGFRTSGVINSSGQIAYHATFTGGEGIFLDNQLVAELGDTIGGNTIDLFVGNSITLNDSGTAAFYARADGVYGYYTPNSFLTEVGDTIGSETLRNLGQFSREALNNNGELVFSAGFNPSPNSGLATLSNVLAKNGDVIGGKALSGFSIFPTMNDSGQTMFHGAYAGNTVAAIFTLTTLVADTGDTIGGKTLTGFDAQLSLNESGDMVFVGAFAGGEGVFTPTSLIVGTGDVIDGKTINSVGHPSLNNAGGLALDAYFGSSDYGIFTPTAFIAGTGTTIDGTTLDYVYSPMTSDNGSVVFSSQWWGTASGSGIFLATDAVAAVPEPATCLLLAGGLVLLRSRRRRN